MHCDNERALGKASIYRRRIPPGSKHADLLRLLRSVKHDLQHDFTYHHIYGHADRKKLWHQLTLVEKLNVLCDNWAKGARLQGLQLTRATDTQSLPREKAAIFIRGIKATGDLSNLGSRRPGSFTSMSWVGLRRLFDSVDWLSLNFALSKKSKMYAVWLAKQASGFCGTRPMTSRYAGSSNDCCPNCLHPEEDARHLNLCLNQERTRQFVESVKDLANWLDRSITYPDLAFWIPRYLLGRNKVKFAELHTMSSKMRASASGPSQRGSVILL
jgi:hypothetical protein